MLCGRNVEQEILKCVVHIVTIVDHKQYESSFPKCYKNTYALDVFMKCNCRIVVTVYNLKTHHHVRSSPDIQMASFDPENRHQLQTCVSMSILFSVLSPLYLNLISFPSPPKKKNSRSFLTQILS